MTDDDPLIQPAYDEMWQRATTAFQQHAFGLDPQLLAIDEDHRLGLGCIIRPDLAALPAALQLLAQLVALAPEQHLYRPAELHVSVLTPIPSFVGFALAALPRARYQALFAAAAAACAPFTLSFRGVTASPSAIMLQGFFAPQTLDALRGALFAALDQAGLAATLDRRYPLRGAHMTLLRFKQPPRDPSQLYQWLAERRQVSLGTCQVTAIELVTADWYMSQAKVRTIARMPLQGGTHEHG